MPPLFLWRSVMDKVSKKELLKFMKQLFNFMAVPVFMFFIAEFGITGLFTEDPFCVFMNVFFYEAAAFILLFLFNSASKALNIEAVISFIWMMLNCYLIRWRSSPLLPWDIYSVKTAVTVAGGYSLVPDTYQIISILFYIGTLIYINTCIKKEGLHFKNRKRVFGTASSFLCVIIWYIIITECDIPVFDKGAYGQNVNSAMNGSVLNFFYQMRNLDVEPPEGYSEEKTASILSEYTDKSKKSSGDKVNIIAVMCESFSDPSVLGDVRADKDYIPYIHFLMNNGKNTISGILNVSVIGGNTVNTEWEFLTGNSVKFIPSGAVPYAQYINDKTDLSYALPEELKENGYQTISIHPYIASGYNRDIVYKRFGFEKMLFDKDFNDPEMVRSFVSDREVFKKIISEYESRDKSKPVFEFAVTMQNHAYYSNEDKSLIENREHGLIVYGDGTFSMDPSVSVSYDHADALETYLTLESITDSAVKELVEYFDKQDEKTLIVFFGDHQPAKSVTGPIKKKSSIEEADYYKVPFFIHANFDIEGSSGIDTSPNFLGGIMLDKAGVKLNPYRSFLFSVEEDTPIVSVVKDIEETEKIKEYRIVEYHNVFSK